MDKLAEQLKRDAEMIDAGISDELDRRINASLHSVSPEQAVGAAAPQRSTGFWWASSLTGIAAALVLIVVLNTRSGQDELPAADPGTSPVAMTTTNVTPIVEWNARSAMLTSPLQEELDDLQSDLDKVRKKAREDIGL